MDLRAPQPQWTETARHLATLWRVQGGLCSICGTPVEPIHRPGKRHGASRDHTFPRAMMHNGRDRPPGLGRHARWRRGGWVTMAHTRCNNAKGSRWPTGCEMIWLLAVKARMAPVTPNRRAERLEIVQRELAA